MQKHASEREASTWMGYSMTQYGEVSYLRALYADCQITPALVPDLLLVC